MNQIDRFNDMVSYIEDNLDSDIDILELSKIVGCSSYQLVRMFPFIAGISITEYIKKRRLTKAAHELQDSSISVTDVCYKYGYNSPTSFSRAFQNLHGVTPSAAKEQGVSLNSYLPITFKTIIMGGIEMNYKIVELDEFRVVGLKRSIDLCDIEGENDSVEIPRFWNDLIASGELSEICKLINKPPFGAIGVYGNIKDDQFCYYITASTDIETPPEYAEYVIPKNTYAVFSCTTDNVHETWRKITSDWLPSSKYEYADGVDFELYKDDVNCEIHVPITK